MKSDAVRAGAKRFAAALDGPFGRRSLHWAIEQHLNFFVAARATGATWSQIAQALVFAGAVADDGGAIKSNVLSATVSRIMRSARSKADASSSSAVARPDEQSFQTTTGPVNGSPPLLSLPAPKNPAPMTALPSDFARVRERMERAAELRGKHKT